VKEENFINTNSLATSTASTFSVDVTDRFPFPLDRILSISSDPDNLNNTNYIFKLGIESEFNDLVKLKHNSRATTKPSIISNNLFSALSEETSSNFTVIGKFEVLNNFIKRIYYSPKSNWSETVIDTLKIELFKLDSTSFVSIYSEQRNLFKKYVDEAQIVIRLNNETIGKNKKILYGQEDEKYTLKNLSFFHTNINSKNILRVSISTRNGFLNFFNKG
jgi:hypothetical protein